MVTFFATFSAIEFLLPRLYRRELVHEHDLLMYELQTVLIEDLQYHMVYTPQSPLSSTVVIDEIRTTDEIYNTILMLEEMYLTTCADDEGWRELHHHFISMHPCRFITQELNTIFAIYHRINTNSLLVTPIYNTINDEIRPIEWFHFRKIREHHEEYGSIVYTVLESILYDFAMTHNVRILVWDIPPHDLHGLGEVLFDIEGRSAEMEFMTTLGSTEIGIREQRYNDYLIGGFAIAISGTFQPAYRVLNIITTLSRQILIAILVFSVVISYLFSRYVAKPIVALSNESKKLIELKFEENVKIKRRDEIGNLSSNLNFMSYKLKRTLEDLYDANEKLKIEMEKEREQERQRRNLFTSISHELKTPITILKGEIGGMIDKIGDYKDRDTYLMSAHKWTENLEKLVAEILQVTRIEDKTFELNRTMIKLDELVKNIITEQMALANSREITLHHQLDLDISINVDAKQLKIAISNVINNAIFYSNKDAQVIVTLKKDNKHANLTILNTNAHILDDAIKNLFQPFFRVDQSRNRHTGGSGLGLFIVKNILELHDMSYNIENTADGVLFTINLPLA